MNAAALDRKRLECLTRPGDRLPGLARWLLTEVWAQAAFEAAGESPQGYLRFGEELVNERENLLRAAAPSLFDELSARPADDKSVGLFCSRNARSAVVVFDGCSLREMPRLLELARASRREVLEIGCGRAAIPTETEYFVSDRLGLGLPAVGPSQLAGRTELKQRNIRFYYYRQD